MTRRINLSIICVISLLMILATAASALAAEQTYMSGTLSKVKGKIEVTPPDQMVRLNPNRPSRVIDYNYGPRSAYRAGDLSYYDRRKIAREETRPAWGSGVQAISSKSKTSFTKNAPHLYPETTGSQLRQSIDTSNYQWGSKYKFVKPLDAKSVAISRIIK